VQREDGVPRDGWFFSDLMQSIVDRGRALVGLGRTAIAGHKDILRLAKDLLSRRGEASGVALAHDILAAYGGLPAAENGSFCRVSPSVSAKTSRRCG
jgi:malonyl-CoA decarboxylase